MSDNKTVRAWDPLVRVFHWLLVVAFAAAFVTGEVETDWHNWLGYAIGVLLVVRIAWGLIGPRTARFSDFIRSPRTIGRYLKDWVRGRADHYIGHNPAGGAMILVMLILLTLATISGWLLTVEGWQHVDAIEELHEISTHLMLPLIAVHVIGVVVSSVLHRENLLKAMVTGRKRRHNQQPN